MIVKILYHGVLIGLGSRTVSSKKKTLNAIFQSCKEAGNFNFDNKKVKRICEQTGFGNPFDVTKIDNSNLLPDEMREENYCVVHLGRGRHRFMPIADVWYHRLETVSQNERKPWKYKPSVLNHTDMSESNVISFAYNQRIIQSFLYGDIAANPKIYMSRRTKITTSYSVGTEKIEVEGLQMELDATFEFEGKVTVLEAKNGFPPDFTLYQLFHPCLDYHEKKIKGVKEIMGCYLLRDKDAHTIRLYLYTFTRPDDMMSIHLVKKAEYILEGEES